MSRDITPFGLRMPPSLRAMIEAAAKESGRSLNSEIVHRLIPGGPAMSADQAKRAVVTEALLEAVAEAIRWWDAVNDMPDQVEYREDLKRAMDDLEMWFDRLQRLESKS